MIKPISAKLFVMMLLSLLLSACATHRSADPVIENPYVERMQGFNRHGVEAMHREQWKAAMFAFKRALQMAILTNDPVLITRAWYNIAMVYKALQQREKAENALQHVLKLAHQHDLSVDEKRAELQLTLLHFKQLKGAQKTVPLVSGWPVDIYLMAAKLAYLQHDDTHAKQAYKQALQLVGNDRLGLLSQAKASLGLALLAKRDDDGMAAKAYAMKVLELCREIGAPRLSAHASLLLAGLQAELSRQQRLDYAQRADSMYELLHDSDGQAKASALLGALHE